MTRVAWLAGCLFGIVVANAVAQSCSTTTETEVCTAEDYAISTVALNDLFAKQKPDRVMLRDHTFVRIGATDRANKIFLADVPEDATANFDSRNFDSRNKSGAKIEEQKIKNQAMVVLLSAEEEDKLVKSGVGCDDKWPITFVSLPGFNTAHDRAIISMGTSCYDREHSTFMLLGKDSGDWKVLSRLGESSTIIDRFPSKADDTFAPVEPKVVSVQQTDDGNQSLMKVSFIVPDVPNYTFDTITVYLRRSSGGVIFTTIQKFFPEFKGQKYPMLSDRRNIVVIADEAHRSQYDFIDGFARHMRDALPNASFIGFTGTPIEGDDRSTPAVFGDYIDVYDIQQAVEDEVTVRIYYEGRLAKLELKPEDRPKIDPDFEEVTEGEEVEKKERLKTKWARMEAMVGTPHRIELIAQDLVKHFENRQIANEGKAMVVAMSRRICTDLYSAIVKLRPSWHHNDDDKGLIKVVMTGSAADDQKLQPHVRNKQRREALAKRFKDPGDPMKLVIVRDMWLTGFDVPCLHTMYADKPMQGHGLMQAIARVNRVFGTKPGGLIVDYLGLADQLKKAMANYTQAGGKGHPTFDQEAAVHKMHEHFDVVSSMFHGFDYSKYISGKPAEQVKVVPNAIEHVLAQENGKARYMPAVSALSRAFALSVPHEKAMAVRDQVGFFQTVRAALAKHTTDDASAPEVLDAAVRQIVSRAVASDEVIDIFTAAGLQTPDISILSDAFLEEVRRLPQKNLAIEALRKLLNDQVKTQSKKNLVQSRLFSDMLQKTIQKYQNRSLDAAEIIAELVNLAKNMREANGRGEKLKMSDEEVAFYDALEVNDSAVKVLGDETLRQIALELVDAVRRNVTIDWTVKEGARANIRRLVKRILREHGYPPDKQETATLTVLTQAELLCKDWAVA